VGNEDARLRFSRLDEPGIRRVRWGRGFRYRSANGRWLRHRPTLARIRGLAIPPAWNDVWISTDANGHIQATGRDGRGRKQYRYHPLWRPRRDMAKYQRLIEFGEALPAIRKRVRRDLARPGLPRQRVLAAIVRLLEETMVRVGNEEYARANRSFGLTTLRRRHAVVTRREVRIRFRGKGGQLHEASLRDRRVARIVRRCHALPGQPLFEYVDDQGAVRGLGSEDVNGYIREISGGDFTAKDFRTWGATMAAYGALLDADPTRRSQGAAIGAAAERLGDTPSVARSAYVPPRLLEAHLEGRLQAKSRRGRRATERQLVSILRAR
jgi:DNA topoisomerase-1